MPTYSFNFGNGHDSHAETWGGGGSSRSRAQSSAGHRRRGHGDFDDLTDQFSRMRSRFDNMWDDMGSGFSRSGFDDDHRPSGFRHVQGTSSRGRGNDSFFHSGFPSRSSRDRSRSFEYEDEESDSSDEEDDFPGMPGEPPRGRQGASSGEDWYTEEQWREKRRREAQRPEERRTEERRPDHHSTSSQSRPFRMWEDQSGSSSHRHRSPSPSYYYGEEIRGSRHGERSQPRAWAPDMHSTSSASESRGYDTGHASTSTSRPFRRERRDPTPPPRRREPSPEQRSRRNPFSFRREEVRRPDTSSRTAGSSHSHRAPEPTSYSPSGYENYARPRAQSTSHNQYRTEERKPRPHRAPSPPRRAPSPRRRAPFPHRPSTSSSRPSHSRSQSHARSGTSSASSSHSGSASPLSRSELKKLFETYNTRWEAISRIDKTYPLPAPSRDLSKLDFHGGSSLNTGNWSNEDIFVANVQVIFLAGFGISSTISKRGDNLGLQINAREATDQAKQALAKWLSRKEQPRWHPDRMNLRTGRQGKLDEEISKRKEVVAMRSAAQGLLAIVS